MEDNKIVLNTDGVSVEVEVIEQTVIDGTVYLLVANSSEEDDYDNCFLLKDVSNLDDNEAVYEELTDELEINKVYDVFKNILSEDEIELEK